MVNLPSADDEAQVVFDRLSLAAARFPRREAGYLGLARDDDALRREARRPGALLGLRHVDVEAIAAQLDGPVTQKGREAPAVSRGMAT